MSVAAQLYFMKWKIQEATARPVGRQKQFLEMLGLYLLDLGVGLFVFLPE